ncbi:unnamed protein product, partial [Rotaria sordida]
MSINDYMLNPPKNIIEKFQEVTIINPTYNEALTTVKKMSIRSKFEEEFERSKSKIHPNPEKLEHLKKDIKKFIQDTDRKLDNVFNSENPKKY